ncbi:MAG: glycosyltransferase family 39 protein [Anaerolineae bacterium]|nr:glycosyltransferase family 39 protein [Anaerolineae bacterium]
MTSTTLHRRHLLDALFIGLLGLYILAGVLAVPLHGDESTIIFMSRDVEALRPDQIATLFFHDPPRVDPAVQELRLLNGSITFFGMGALWKLAGFQAADVNEQWDWGADYAYNQTTGHIPSARLLFVARLWSAFCTLLSTAILFAIAKRLMPRMGAWIAALAYVLLPALLLNGRRASFEGSVQITLMLLLWSAVVLTQRIAAGRDKAIHWLLVGLAAGASAAAKHNSLLVILPVVGIVIIYDLVRQRDWARSIGRAALTALATVAIFLALSPAWWSADPHIPSTVVQLRFDLMRNQSNTFGGFADFGQRLNAALTAVIAPPQYYEVNAGWPEWLAESIRQYEVQPFLLIPLRGIPLPPISLIVVALGVLALPRTAAAMLIRVSAVSTLLSLLLLNPLPWQRYYLPLAPFYALLYGAGITYLAMVARRWIEARRVRAA